MTGTKIRKAGLLCSIAAVAGFGVAVIADNRNLGFGYCITRRDQLGLLVAAVMICALQLTLYVAGRGKGTHAEGNHHNKRV
jgi:hypothetical protein